MALLLIAGGVGITQHSSYLFFIMLVLAIEPTQIAFKDLGCQQVGPLFPTGSRHMGGIEKERLVGLDAAIEAGRLK